MIITCIAHAMFLLETDSGLRIVTDPVGEDSGFPVKPVKADVALVSHHHHDHCALENAPGAKVIETAGVHCPADGLRVKAVKSFHDDVNGTKRGENLLFLIEAEGLRVAHLGDLGHLPTPTQREALGRVDVLMLPVGGFYTIDAAQAKETAALLGAKVILPMHYRTEVNADWPITPIEAFTGQYPAGSVAEMPLVRITADDLKCHKPVVVLTPQMKG